MTTLDTLLHAPEVDTPTERDAFGGARRRRIRRPGVHSLVLGIYAVISVIADLPIWPGDPARVPTMLGEDIYQTAWFLEWTPYALLHGRNVFETGALNYPAGVNLAQNTGVPLLGLLTAPLTLAVSPIASENLLRFLGFTLSAYAAYWVLRKFISWTPAAFIGGLLYGFSPYMLTQGSIHLNLMFVPLPPLLLYGLFELVVLQQTRPVRRGLWIGAVAVAQYFISVEVLATTLLIAGVGIFFLFFSCIREVPARFRHAAIGCAVAGVVVAVWIAYPTWVMFFGPAHYAGPAQGYGSVFNADLLGAAVPTPFQLVDPASVAKTGASLVSGQTQENGSYLGLPLVALLIGVVAWGWRKLWPIYLAMMIVTSWLLSLGPRLIVDGRVHNLPFALPFRKIARLPGIDNILPVRFSLYVVFFAAIVLAMAIDNGWRSFQARRAAADRRRAPATRWAARGVVGVVVIAAVIALLPAWPYKSYRVRLNVGVRPDALSIIPDGAVVMTYPYPTTFLDSPMVWQANDHMRFQLLGGYALVPGRNGRASVFPQRLEPRNVQLMLIDSVSPVSVPGYPTMIATSKTIAAATVTIDRGGVTGPTESKHAFRGKVIGVDARRHMVYIRHGFGPIAIRVSDATVYVERSNPHPSLAEVVQGEVITVTGTPGPGTVTPELVGELRAFLRNAHVQAVVVGLGTTDAGVIAAWLRDALGPPTRAGGGGEIWTHVDVTDRHGA